MLLAAALLSLAPQDPTHLTATFVDQSGAPVPGVEVTVKQLGAPALRGRADDRGRLDVRMPLDEVEVLVLTAEAPGMLVDERRLEPRPALDLGRVVLGPGGVIVGRVVDPAGDSLPGAWTITARTSSTRRALRSLEAPVDPASGEFRLEGVAPGPVSLIAEHRALGVHAAIGEVVVEHGAETFAELQYEGPDPRRCLAPSFTVPGAPRSMAPVQAEVTDAEGTLTTVSVGLRRGRGSYLLTELGPGPYRVAVHDPRFLPATVDGAAGGSAPQVVLRGAGTLALDARVRGQGPVPHLGVHVERDGLRTTIVPDGSPYEVGQEVPGVLWSEGLKLVLVLPGRRPVVVTCPKPEGSAAVPLVVELEPAVDLVVTLMDRGLPAANLIDFDYPYWHTHADDLRAVAPASLAAVGRLLLALIYSP